MAVSEDGSVPMADQDFVDRSYLTYIVPFETDLNVEEALRHAKAPGKAIEEIEQREWLFFGMNSPPSASKRALVSQLAHS